MPISIENFSFSTFLSVDFGNSVGSGFRLKIGEKEFIITAKHVIVNNKNQLLKDLWIKSRNYSGDELDGYSAKVDLTPSNVTTIDEFDIAIIELEKDCNFIVENLGTDISLATVDDLSKFEEIKIGRNIFLIGFPSSLTVDDFYDVDRPLLRTGIVAGKNVKKGNFVIDSMAYYGVSGGPVVQINKDEAIKIIGVVSRFIPFITEWKNKHEQSLSRQDFFNSGYAVCSPIDSIIQALIK